MNKYLSVLKKSPLFADIEETCIETILPCLSAVERQYEKNSFIYSADERVFSVGLILSGSVYIMNEDYWGNRYILSHLGPSELFAEAFSCTQEERIPVNVITAEKTDIMLINCKKIVKTCSSDCVFHTQLIQNMLQILANKNILLMQKIEQMSKRTTREKLLAYLSDEAQKKGRHVFDIPFNRQQLADYLSVDRSAMSAELGKMRDDGLLSYNRNHFELRESKSS